MSEPPNLDTPRERILSGARQAFLRFGYDGASMRTITEFTGYSQAGISHHFASKADLLTAVVDESFSRVEEAVEIGQGDDVASICRMWRNLTRLRDDVAMRTVTISEAAIAGHPAQDRSIDSLNKVRTLIANRLPAMAHPELFADILEGLQKRWLYDAGLDGAALLSQTYLALSSQKSAPDNDFQPQGLGSEWSTALQELTSQFRDPDLEEHLADEKRQTILNTAMRVFGENGYVGASLRQIAGELGVTHPALLRHYPSKDLLFRSVLERHDVGIVDAENPLTPREAILQLLIWAQALEEVPGLVPLYTAIDARSYQPGTPFHGFFSRQGKALTDVNRTVFEGLAEVQEIRQDLNPTVQGQVVLTLWDGVQIRWTLDQSFSTRMALALYLDRILNPALSETDLEYARTDPAEFALAQQA